MYVWINEYIYNKPSANNNIGMNKKKYPLRKMNGKNILYHILKLLIVYLYRIKNL